MSEVNKAKTFIALICLDSAKDRTYTYVELQAYTEGYARGFACSLALKHFPNRRVSLHYISEIVDGLPLKQPPAWAATVHLEDESLIIDGNEPTEPRGAVTVKEKEEDVIITSGKEAKDSKKVEDTVVSMEKHRKRKAKSKDLKKKLFGMDFLSELGESPINLSEDIWGNPKGAA